MKTKLTAKPVAIAKKPARQAGAGDLPVGKRQAKGVKGGAIRSGR